MCGIILFIDGTNIDHQGRHNLEPVCLTLSIFNYATRCKPQAWRVLAYIKKNVSLGMDTTMELRTEALNKTQKRKSAPKKTPEENALPTVHSNCTSSLADYHAMLSVIFSDLERIQNNKEGLRWDFRVGRDQLGYSRQDFFTFSYYFYYG